MFMEFLQGLALFGPQASAESMQELVGIIEGQADLNAAFQVPAPLPSPLEYSLRVLP